MNEWSWMAAFSWWLGVFRYMHGLGKRWKLSRNFDWAVQEDYGDTPWIPEGQSERWADTFSVCWQSLTSTDLKRELELSKQNKHCVVLSEVTAWALKMQGMWRRSPASLAVAGIAGIHIESGYREPWTLWIKRARWLQWAALISVPVYSLPAVWPWACDFTSLCLSSLVCKIQW